MDKRGFQLKLEKEVKKLDTPEVFSDVPVRKCKLSFNIIIMVEMYLTMTLLIN